METWRQELYLTHHGILGQKWGKRNGPPYPLSAGDHSASEKKAGWRRSLNSSIKRHAETLRSDYRKGLEAKYLEKHNKRTLFHKPENKTDQDAERYAESRTKAREKTYKALLTVGGVTIAAAAAYYAYNHAIPQYVDKTLKAGTEFKRVTMNANDTELGRAFYAARSKRDQKKYIGLYGSQLVKNAKLINNEEPKNETLHQITLKAQGPLRIASHKSAAKTFRELYETDERFRRAANERIEHIPALFETFEMRSPGAMVGTNAANLVKSGRARSDRDFMQLYRAFNMGLSMHDLSSENDVNIFYDALKKKGYGAINDINDQWYSSYNSRTANIVFDTDRVVRSGLREVGDKELQSLKISENAKQIVPLLLPLVGSGLVTAMISDDLETVDRGRQEREKSQTSNIPPHQQRTA